MSEPTVTQSVIAMSVEDGRETYITQVQLPADADPQATVDAFLQLPQVNVVRHQRTETVEYTTAG